MVDKASWSRSARHRAWLQLLRFIVWWRGTPEKRPDSTPSERLCPTANWAEPG